MNKAVGFSDTVWHNGQPVNYVTQVPVETEC